LQDGQATPPWVLSKQECIAADECMHHILGASTFEERPFEALKAEHAANSHDTILWATVYARWCLRKKGTARYTNNVCDIFDIMATLNATRLNAAKVMQDLKPRLINAMAQRSGLLPPTECMITLHELLHVCDEQVSEVGAPRVSSLICTSLRE